MNRHPAAAPPPYPAASLSAARRERELAELAGGLRVDVLVVGLGVTGAGVALDAASRGLSVAAVDAHDLASGTSRWSSKLVHGGLRYLASGQVGLAHESAVERGILIRRTAPHLVRAQPFLLPLTPLTSRRGAALARAGLHAGNVLRLAAGTPRATLPAPRTLSAGDTLRAVPGLRRHGLRGALLSWDGQLTDDARLVTAVARTAAAHGARILTRVRALELAGDGALARDELTGEHLRIHARAVINAAGVWAGRLVEGVRLRPSRGTHLVLRPESLGGLRRGPGLHIPLPGHTSRFALVLPQGDGRVYAGLTDEPAGGPLPGPGQDVSVPETDIGFLLDVLAGVLEVPVRREEVAGTFAGLRPLLDAGTGATADLSRRHAVLTSAEGIVTVIGGKLTTYRRMAQDAVDTALRARRLNAPASPTARLPLVGAAPPAVLAALPAPRRLVARYGTEAPAVHALAATDPWLAARVVPGNPVTRAELLWAVRHEAALDVGDLLDRRTRLGLIATDRRTARQTAQRILGGAQQGA